jgi:hypothetical protein
MADTERTPPPLQTTITTACFQAIAAFPRHPAAHRLR